MTLRNFIRDNRSTIDAQINSVRFRHDGRGGRGVIPEPAPKYNDNERREWVLNDEPLYRFAQAEGVRI